MRYYYYEIDVIKRMIIIYDSELLFSDDDFSLSESRAAHISFNEMINLIEDYSHKPYIQEIKNLSDMMMLYVSRGREQNLKIRKQYESLCIKFKNNILAKICLDILYNKYENQRNELLRYGIKNIIDELCKKAEAKIKSTYKELFFSMNDLVLIANKTFTNIFNTHKVAFSGFQLDIDDRSMVVFHQLTESFAEFNRLFINSVDMGKLKVYTCCHCNKRFFDDKEARYCQADKCQEAKKKEADKLRKAQRQNSPYSKTIDGFFHYCTEKAHELKRMNIDKETVELFKEKAEPYKENVKDTILYYRDTLKPLPPEIEKYIKEQKRCVKKIYDDILIQLGLLRKRGRPKKK